MTTMAITSDQITERTGELAVEALQADDSQWPVRTGESRDSFGYRVEGDDVQITNTTDYAAHVEARTGAAEATLEAAEDQIAADLDTWIVRELNG